MLSLPSGGSQWRFFFGIGPDKTAVLIMGSRSRNVAFLPGGFLPWSGSLLLLGTRVSSSRSWRKHAQRRTERSIDKFHQSISWAENRGLCTNFRSSMSSLLYGSQFLDVADKEARQFGHRLLMWPRGAPGAAVVGPRSS